MIIQIDGINTLNKGAELMLVAILEELEKKYPGATVYLNPDSVLDQRLLPKYNLNVKKRFGLRLGRYINGLCFRIHINNPFSYFKENYAPKNVDFILDASGFKYSDQWNRSDKWLDIKENYYRKAKINGIKIYFLTQALGPFRSESGKRSIQMLSKYSDLIFAREETSYNYAIEAKADSNKLKVSCDFTLKVSGEIPSDLEHLKGSIAIIPNKKMITHGGNKSEDYLNLFLKIIKFFKEKEENIFLLNHESLGDYKICQLINSHLDSDLEIVSGVTAKEIKGVIGVSKMVISSRFHGVASSLSQGVPCLATSWNHKYEMLFKNFDQKDCVLNANNKIEDNLMKIESIYQDYNAIQTELRSRKPELVNQINNMWEIIFDNYEQSYKS